ncbi:MAG: GTPase ObgE [bacterium]
MRHFVDEVEIRVESGRGGDGCVAFRREKFVPRGGPSGGDGGSGGSVVVVADGRMRTLLDFRSTPVMKARNGEPGKGKQMNGRAGEDCVIRLPVGTLIVDAPSGTVLVDLTVEGQRHVVAQGGHGGRGNVHFATSTNRAPRQAEEGRVGEARDLKLELKLMADVGILGFPNAGKSTFIRRVSRARPKVAAYPFTTLIPHLGVCELSDHRSLVIADIPGLVEGASEGAGLGHRFLRHLERTSVLLHLIDPSDLQHETALDAFDTLNRELRAHSERLGALPQVVAINKVDLPQVRDLFPALVEAFESRGISLRAVSGATGEGAGKVLEDLAARLGV